MAVCVLLACNEATPRQDSLQLEQARKWKLSELPVLVVGAGDGSEGLFGRVAGAIRLPNGWIVVSDISPPGVKLFDSLGRYRRLVGATGGGPGEFKWPGAPQVFVSDSFFIVDIEQRRVSFFDAEANHTATRRFSLQLEDGSIFSPIGMVSSAEFVARVMANRHATRVGERFRIPIEIVAGRFGQSDFDVIARGEGDERVGGVYLEAGERTLVAYPLEFGSTTQIAVAHGLVYTGETAQPRIAVYDLTGRLVRKVTWGTKDDPITEADRRSRIAQESTRIANIQGPDPGQIRSALEHLRTVKLPRSAPAFTMMLPAADGALWVEVDPRPWTPTRDYLVFDSAGALTARVAMPRQFKLYQVRDTFVVGRWRDPDETDQVRVYRTFRQ